MLFFQLIMGVRIVWPVGNENILKLGETHQNTKVTIKHARISRNSEPSEVLTLRYWINRLDVAAVFDFELS